MKQFNIAMVGCGGVSGMHLAGYVNHPDRLSIAAACDVDLSRAQAAAEKYSIPLAFGSIADAVAGADWQVAVVCTPTPVRLQVVAELAAAGKCVLVEKPMADSFGEATQIVDACDKAGVKLAVNQNFRWHYGFDIAKGLIADGRLGKVHSVVHTSMHLRQDAGWRIGCKRHTMSVMGVHWFDGFRWMLGSEADSIFCRTHSSDAVDCLGETDAAVQIHFACGTTVTYAQSFSSPISRCETLVLGDKASLVVGNGVALFDADNRDEPIETWDNPCDGGGISEAVFKSLDELLTAIEAGAEPVNSGRDNLKTIALLDSAYRSAETGKIIELQGGLPK